MLYLSWAVSTCWLCVPRLLLLRSFLLLWYVSTAQLPLLLLQGTIRTLALLLLLLPSLLLLVDLEWTLCTS